jgi:uncharacterized protein YjdB
VRAAAPPPPVAVASVKIEPDSLTLQIGATAQLRATAYDAQGNVLTGRAVAWTSSGAAVTVAAAGTVTGAAEGSALVTATVEGVEGRLTVKVLAAAAPPPAAVASVKIEPDTLTLQVGAAAQLRATAYDAQGNVLTGRVVVWTSSSASVITLGAAGSITGAGEGSATITATVEGVSGRATVKVLAATPPPPAAVASVKIEPDTLTLQAGATAQLRATAYDAQGGVLTGRAVVWTSSSAAIVALGTGGT